MRIKWSLCIRYLINVFIKGKNDFSNTEFFLKKNTILHIITWNKKLWLMIEFPLLIKAHIKNYPQSYKC